ncbi:MAG TPA: polyphosphate kinase 2, partial [Kiritimatiellia bacterium]|nr:polyphosphate kinase 2 [Kiritimatiellia bacterium]
MATTPKAGATKTPRTTAPRRTRIRAATAGDIGPTATPNRIESFAVGEAVDGAQESRLAALRDIVSGIPADEGVALLKGLLRQQRIAAGALEANPDDVLAPDWRDGGYPYKNLMQRRTYERQKYRLQVELLKLQAWVKESGQKVVILFEGRDAAGKGGTIKRFMENLNPRGARVVALEKPTETERGQWYF